MTKYKVDVMVDVGQVISFTADSVRIAEEMTGPKLLQVCCDDYTHNFVLINIRGWSSAKLVLPTQSSVDVAVEKPLSRVEAIAELIHHYTNDQGQVERTNKEDLEYIWLRCGVRHRDTYFYKTFTPSLVAELTPLISALGICLRRFPSLSAIKGEMRIRHRMGVI